MASAVTAIPSTRVSEAEWQTRLDLAACYRLVDQPGPGLPWATSADPAGDGAGFSDRLGGRSTAVV